MYQIFQEIYDPEVNDVEVDVWVVLDVCYTQVLIVIDICIIALYFPRFFYCFGDIFYK